jgi:hypothetical protein
MTAVAERRRFQFSLRTLLVVMALVGVAGWLGLKLNWIRQRHAFLRSSEATGEFDMPIDECRPPGLLGMFGEKGRRWIFIHVKSSDRDVRSDAELARVRAARWLFPESEIEEIPTDYLPFFERFFPERDAKLKADSATR